MAQGKIFSALDYPVSVAYGDSQMQIPARALGLKVGNIKKLGKLPMGITIVEIKEAK